MRSSCQPFCCTPSSEVTSFSYPQSFALLLVVSLPFLSTEFHSFLQISLMTFALAGEHPLSIFGEPLFFISSAYSSVQSINLLYQKHQHHLHCFLLFSKFWISKHVFSATPPQWWSVLWEVPFSFPPIFFIPWVLHDCQCGKWSFYAFGNGFHLEQWVNGIIFEKGWNCWRCVRLLQILSKLKHPIAF